MCNLLPLTAHSVQVLLQGSHTSNVTFMPLVEILKLSPCNREFITNSEYLNRNTFSCLSEQDVAAVGTVGYTTQVSEIGVWAVSHFLITFVRFRMSVRNLHFSFCVLTPLKWIMKQLLYTVETKCIRVHRSIWRNSNIHYIHYILYIKGILDHCSINTLKYVHRFRNKNDK